MHPFLLEVFVAKRAAAHVNTLSTSRKSILAFSEWINGLQQPRSEHSIGDSLPHNYMPCIRSSTHSKPNPSRAAEPGTAEVGPANSSLYRRSWAFIAPPASNALGATVETKDHPFTENDAVKNLIWNAARIIHTSISAAE